jgi:hypothetical protein
MSTEMAYLAGLIDGEGTVSCTYNQNGVPALFLSIGMCDQKLIKELHHRYGGSFGSFKNKKYNRVWQWRLNGHDLKDFLIKVEPYIRLKKKSVKIGIKFLKTLKPRKGVPRDLPNKVLQRKLKLAEQIRKCGSRFHPIPKRALDRYS